LYPVHCINPKKTNHAKKNESRKEWTPTRLCRAQTLDEETLTMLPISVEGYGEPGAVIAGPAPMLQWLNIQNLVVDTTYQRPIVGKGRKHVDRIARAFSWSCFAPVVVSPIEGGKFTIIDGQHRTTAAALVGFDSVPCQVVIAAPAEQAKAFKAINSITTPVSVMALYAAALAAKEPWAVEVADTCGRAEVELLRYAVPLEKQAPTQTMAIGAIAKCLKRYGRDTLITALQCVTQTANNKPGILSARVIKALCEVLHHERQWRDSGLALLDAFDRIDLQALEIVSKSESVARGVSRTAVLKDLVQVELEQQLLPGTKWCIRDVRGYNPGRDEPARGGDPRPGSAYGN
jgi:hypothetical protein